MVAWIEPEQVVARLASPLPSLVTAQGSRSHPRSRRRSHCYDSYHCRSLSPGVRLGNGGSKELLFGVAKRYSTVLGTSETKNERRDKNKMLNASKGTSFQ